MRILKLLSVFLIWGILFLCLPSSAPTQEVSGYTALSAVELKKLQDGGKEILLIDTRPHPAYKQEHIPGAKHFEFPTGIWNNGINQKLEEKARKSFLGFSGRIRINPSSSIVQMPIEHAATAEPVGLSN